MYKNNLLHVATVSLLFAFKNGAISDDGDIENNKTLHTTNHGGTSWTYFVDRILAP